MIFRIEGHELPIATPDDFTAEELAAHAERRVWDPKTDGDHDMEIPTGDVPGKSVPFNMQHGEGKSRGATFTLVPPVSDDDQQLDLASLRPVRVAGHKYTDEDSKHQRRLFLAVGAVTVAAGHVEMALKKVLVSLTGGENRDLASKNVPADWNELHTKISKLCKNNPSDLAQRVAEQLDAAEAEGLRDTRNNIVHGSWWLAAIDSGELWSGRCFRGDRPPVCISDRAENLYGTAAKLFDLAAALEALVAPRWPLAICPPITSVSTGGDVVDLETRLDRIDDLLKAIKPAARPKPGAKPQGRGRKKPLRRR